MSPLYFCIVGRHQNLCKLLVKKGAKFYFDGSDTEKDLSPIFIAVILRNLELLVLMLKDAMIARDVLNSAKQTPLMYAAQYNISEIVNYLSLRDTNLN